MAISVMLGKLAEGMWVSVAIFAVTLVFSLPLGLLVSFGRMSKNIVIRTIVKVYISIMRGTPLMLQLIAINFGPYYGLGIPNTPGWKNMAVAIGFVLNYAAYFAEIYRGGIESMPQGQYEAAKVLGISEMQTKFKIVMPQMFRISLPSVANETVILLKDTALITAIGLSDLLKVTTNIVNRTTNVSAYIVAAAFYLVLSYLLTILFKKLEKKFAF